MYTKLVEVSRNERISAEMVRATLKPVPTEQDPHPIGEHYVDIPAADEQLTGTRYTVSYVVEEEG